MIGLGRMGGNMVRRLLQGGSGHELIVYDQSADAVKAHAAKGVKAAKDLADVTRQLVPRRVVWGDGAGWRGREAPLSNSCRISPAATSSSTAATRTSRLAAPRGGAQGTGDRVRGRRTSGGIWGLAVGYCLMIGASPAAFQHCEPIFRNPRAARGLRPRGPLRRRPTTSRWCTMGSSTDCSRRMPRATRSCTPLTISRSTWARSRSCGTTAAWCAPG